jgi:hypothetical protein
MTSFFLPVGLGASSSSPSASGFWAFFAMLRIPDAACQGGHVVLANLASHG